MTVWSRDLVLFALASRRRSSQESGKFPFYFLCASSFETSSVFKNSLLSINGITKRLSDLNGVRNENFNHGSHKSGWEERGVGRNGE